MVGLTCRHRDDVLRQYCFEYQKIKICCGCFRSMIEDFVSKNEMFSKRVFLFFLRIFYLLQNFLKIFFCIFCHTRHHRRALRALYLVYYFLLFLLFFLIICNNNLLLIYMSINCHLLTPRHDSCSRS